MTEGGKVDMDRLRIFGLLFVNIAGCDDDVGGGDRLCSAAGVDRLFAKGEGGAVCPFFAG